MTIQTTSSFITWPGTGAQSLFTFSFVGGEAAWLEVVYTDAAGVEYQVASSDYTLVLNPPAQGALWGIGGSVTYERDGNPIAVGTSLTLRRTVPDTQVYSFLAQQGFNPRNIEAALDRLCMQNQQTARDFIRDAEGQRIENVGDPVSGADATNAQWVEAFINGVLAGGELVLPVQWELSGDGITTEFSIFTANDITPTFTFFVTIDGVSQTPGSDFTVDIAQQSITFDTAPPSGSAIVVRCFGYAKAIGIPGPGTITNSMIVSVDADKVDFTSPAGGTQTVQNMLTAQPRQAIEFGILSSNSAAQNAVAFTDMVNWLNINGGLVEFEAAEYTVNFASVPAITINGGGLIGQGGFAGGTVFRNASATGDTLVLDGAQHFLISGIWFHPSVFRDAGTFEVVMTDSAYCCRLEDCRFDYAANAFHFLNASECEVINCQARYIHDSFGFRFAGTAGIGSYRARLENFKANNPYPTGVYGTVKAWAGTTAFSLNDIVAVNGMVLQCVTAGTTSGTAPATFPQTTPEAPFFTDITDGTVKWRFVFRTSLQWIVQDSYAYSLVIQKAAVINGYRGFAQFDGVASGSSYPIWCWADGLECDHSYSENVLLSGGEGFYASLSWFGSAMTGNGVTFGAAHKGEVTFAAGTRIAAAWQNGIYYAAGPRACLIDGALIGANSVAGSGTYHGVLIDTGAAGVQISGAKIGLLPGIGTNNQGYGVNNLSSVAGALRVDASCDFSGNVSGAISGSYTGVLSDSSGNVSVAGNATVAKTSATLGGSRLLLQNTDASGAGFDISWAQITAVFTDRVTFDGAWKRQILNSGGTVLFDLTTSGAVTIGVGDLTVSRSNAGGAVQIAAANSATGASVSARMSMQTGTANSLLNVRLADNSGAPFAIEECGSAVTAKYFNYPLHVWRSQAGTEWGRLNGTSMLLSVPLRLPSYTVGTVPSAATSGAGAEIYVTNESGGAVPAFSDGANWRRVTDRAIIS